MSDLNEKMDPMLQEMSKAKTPTLTLDGDEKKYDMSFMEPTFGKTEISIEQTDIANAGAVDESMLSDDEKKQVDEFVKKIDISDIKLLNSYGSGAQKGISTFSTNITKSMKTKEFGEIGESLRELRVAISSTTTTEKKGLLGLFQKGKQKATFLLSNYQSAETNIQKIEKDLQHHQQILTKDIYVYDQMYDLNIDFYKELTMYIIAGKKALASARIEKLVELKRIADESNNELDVEKFRDYERACNRFEKRIHDLEISRILSIQQAPQIRLLQDADQQMVDKLRADILNMIPMWRNQMVLALGIQHTTNALNAQSALDEMSNEMFRRNAETLKQGAIDAALASERDILDIDTIRKVNEDILTSINEVVKIHEEGSKRRAEAQEELAKIENELKQGLLEAGSR